MITDFMLDNHSIRKGETVNNKVITDTLVMDASQFTLPYDHGSFSFEFSAMEFSTPEKITYQYRMEGDDNDWMNTNTGVNRVTYTSLRPGKYTFMVRAKDNENFSDIRKVNILITPPWYQTKWATLMWTLLTCLIIYGIVMYLLSRIRHKQELMERIHQEEISEAKLQFFINIFHEIRTPMTLIISPLEKLLAGADQELRPTYLMIYRNAQRILRLINQLMDIRKLDKGQMHLRFRETDIVGFIEDLMQTFDYQAQHKNISFSFQHSVPELKAWVDLNNFDKVLLNVLSNAFKFTPKGGEIRVELTSGTDENLYGPLREYFEITVSDNGIGIEEDKIEQIFERFYQINNDLTKSNFGTGIGLHLSRSLVELHHGTIKVENRKEQSGSRFIIRLPLGNTHLRSDELENPDAFTEIIYPSEKEKEIITIESDDQENMPSLPKKRIKTSYRILIVEDDDEIRQYIKNEFRLEFHISECTNGKEALELIFREKPDLIISDIMMPEMDGMSLSKKIKQNINLNHIPIILLTAKSKTEDRIEGLETGADAYLIKPFNTELLRTTIFNLIENRERLKSQASSEQIMEEKVVKISRKSHDELLMDKIMRIVNERLSDPGLNVETLAADVGMSRVHLHRKLKELTNQSAKNFIRNIRLKQAAILLTENNLTVSEVAYTTGFSNISHFSNSFKEFYGVSPKEYKEQQM
ncbi:MAG: response regulator [Bacteroides sp.]|nr:response regulator [Bacteroides sp.]